MKRQSKLAAAALSAIAAAAAAWVFISPYPSPVGSKLAVLIAKVHPTVMGWPATVNEVAGGFGDPFGVVLDRAGNVYVADAGEQNRIQKIGPDGAMTVLAGGREAFADGAGRAAAFHTPSGLAIDRAGNLFVADTGNNAIRKVTPQGVVSTVAGGGGAGHRDGAAAQALFNGPIGVAVDAKGNLFVADSYNDRIRKIGVDGMVSTIAGGLAPGFQDGPAATALFDTPTGLALDLAGNLYIADAQNGAVRKLDANGQVSTLAQGETGVEEPLMRRPVALALTADGYLYIGDMARGRILQLSPSGQLGGLIGIGIDIQVGDATTPRLGRVAGLALDRDGALYVTDAGRRSLRRAAPRGAPPRQVSTVAAPPALAAAANFPWPVAPQDRKHEVVGVIGEVRGSYDGEARDHFHNGLDVQAAMGAPVLAVADEKVSSPVPNGDFNGLGESLGVQSFAYVHMRVGRTLGNAPLDPSRFTILADDKGKPYRVRVKRGTRFKVGDAVGTVNRMFHVHLIHRTPEGEANPLALPFPELQDTVVPRIDGIALFDAAGQKLVKKSSKRLLVPRTGGALSIVVDAYDQTDGNAARRKLGLYKVGYQLLGEDGSPLAGYEKPRVTIEFNRLPPDPESVKVAYATDSGITVYGNKTTRFLYVVTNKVRDGSAAQGSWDPAALAPGDYIIRVLAADYAGNEAVSGRDLPITVQ
ncbi:MAG: gluconolaconase [Massilia sp.]|nr:gluconolaconase [Massilia sp.]